MFTFLILCICVILQAGADSSVQRENKREKVYDENRPTCICSPTIYTFGHKHDECLQQNEKRFREMGKRLSVIDTKIAELRTACTTPETTTAPKIRPLDCYDIQKDGQRKNGVYTIYPHRASPKGISVSCDFTTDGGGWTVFQRRQDGTVNFFRGWEEYRRGFGNPTGEFWLGNDNIHRLTVERPCELRVDIKDWNGGRSFAEYKIFYIDGAKSKYKLHVYGYRGDAGDSLLAHNNQHFSTKDQDNDSDFTNCAKVYKGGWWYNRCHNVNINGLYYKSASVSTVGITWWHYKKTYVSLKFTEMKVRPSRFGQL